MQDMLEMFKAVCINLPLLDAIRQVPAYARFLKELCTKKRKSRKVPECVMLSEETSSLLQRRLPPKLEDPGAPIIPCVIGDIRVECALLDLGASVNVLPGYFYDMFNLEGLKPTSMTIQMADRSVKIPRGVLENVLLKIEDFMFPVDFVILDMEGRNAENQTPIILSRPFLATANACINCRTGVLEISFGDQKLRMNIFHATMRPAGDRCISFAEAEDEDVDEAAHEAFMTVYTSSFSDPGPDILPGVESSTVLYDNSLGFSFDDFSDDPYPIDTSLHHLIDLASSHSLSFEEREADVLELKPLPHTLKYAYLGSNDSLPVIISSILSLEEERRLLAVLRGHKRAIGWKVSDLRGISPAFCVHRIHTLEGNKPTREFQRRLNPALKEVVKKEIIKWLDAGIIFPISDSEWVSPVQMVPKKAGLTVVKNEHGEDIPMRTQTG
ncbi:unnamed protein product [Victoria cruziana]